MENNIELEIQREIEYYNSLPVKFDNFIYPSKDIPLNDGVIFIPRFNTNMEVPDMKKIPTYNFTIATYIDKLEIGSINLHIGYSKEIYYTGHIGCYINEQHRRKGYAIRATRLLIPLMKAHNMENIILTNNQNNISSMNLCEKLGARFLRTVPVPEWHSIYKQYGCVFHNIYDWSVQ